MPITPQTLVSDKGPTKAPIIQVDFAERYTLEESNGTTDFGEIQAGTIIGKITASGKVRPCAKTKADGAGAGSSSLTVDDASNFYAGDAVYIAGSDSGETVSSKAGNVLTLSGTATWSDDDEIGVGDGSDTALGVLDRDVATFHPEVDEDGEAQHFEQSCMVVQRGVIDEDEVTGDLSSCSSDMAGLTFISR